MTQRLGGEDPTELDRARAVMLATGTSDELSRAIDEYPALSSPIFHAVIRQEYLSLRSVHADRRAGFDARYRELFRLLHSRAYAELCATVHEAPATQNVHLPFLPRFFADLVGVLGDAVPHARYAAIDPSLDLRSIGDDIDEVLGRTVMVPEYAPTPGSHWNVTVVRCPTCKRERLIWRAYAIDLATAPELAFPMREYRINTSPCSECGTLSCVPVRVWIEERPGAGDPLASLSCIWRLASYAYAYEPPPGTMRDPRHDRILEIRCNALMERITWVPVEPTPVVATAISFFVAYSLEELAGYVDQVEEQDAEQPLAMQVMVPEIARKLESGLLPLHQAQMDVPRLAGLAGKDWPLINPGMPTDWKGNLHRFLTQALISEGVAEAKGVQADIRALLASVTSQAFLALGEPGLAESALARAEQLLNDAPEHQRTNAILALASARAELYDALGRHSEAGGLRRRIGMSDFMTSGDSLPRRFARHQLDSYTAMEDWKAGRFADALSGFRRVVQALEEFEKEALDSSDPGARQFLPTVQHNLSGDLANLASVLTDLADQLDTAPPEVIMLLHGESRPALLAEVRRLLQRAFNIAVSVHGWEFAGVQAHRLAMLCRDDGEAHEAEEWALQVLQYASRAGDHRRIWTAACLLADRAIIRNDGITAMEHLRTAARNIIREAVGLGYHGALDSATVLAVGDAACRTVALGAPAPDAIAIVESLKAATTGTALSKRMPARTPASDAQPLARRFLELEKKRESLRLTLGWTAEPTVVTAELTGIQSELRQARAELSILDAGYSRWVDATDVDLTTPAQIVERLLTLGPHTTLLGALPTDGGVWTYGISGHGCHLAYRPLAIPYPARMQSAEFHRRALETGVSALGGSVGRTMLDDDDGPAPVEHSNGWGERYLQRLSGVMLGPVESLVSLMGEDDLLIISPFDWLYGIPFCSLPFKQSVLAEHVSVSSVQGIGVLEACLTRRKISFSSAVCVGAPLHPRLPPLPGALQEIADIVQHFTSRGMRAEGFVQAEATIGGSKAHLPSADVIHFACHAAGVSADGDEARLFLTPDPETNDSGELSEGRVLAEISLDQGALVNLAACTTAAQTASIAPLMAGLVPAFMVAGAGAVLATLWPVRDDLARMFQTDFYAALLNGHGPAQSLAMTQRSCLEGVLGPALQAPEAWGAYVLYGVS